VKSGHRSRGIAQREVDAERKVDKLDRDRKKTRNQYNVAFYELMYMSNFHFMKKKLTMHSIKNQGSE
jgi:hypothetical protein